MFVAAKFDCSEGKLNEMAILYRNVWNIEHNGFLERLQKHCTYEGFRGFAAYTEEQQVAGFSYGYTSLKGQYYRGLLEKELTQEDAAYWLNKCFEFVELAVHPSFRRNGIGLLLAEKLIEEAGTKTAILTTQENNNPARNLYEKINWIVVKEQFYPTQDKSRPFVILGKTLENR